MLYTFKRKNKTIGCLEWLGVSWFHSNGRFSWKNGVYQRVVFSNYRTQKGWWIQMTGIFVRWSVSGVISMARLDIIDRKNHRDMGSSKNIFKYKWMIIIIIHLQLEDFETKHVSVIISLSISLAYKMLSLNPIVSPMEVAMGKWANSMMVEWPS